HAAVSGRLRVHPQQRPDPGPQQVPLPIGLWLLRTIQCLSMPHPNYPALLSMIIAQLASELRCVAAEPQETAATAGQQASVTYLKDGLPIWMGKCARCHNAQNAIMYNWLDYRTAFGDRREIKKRVWDSWRGAYYKQPMPAGNGAELHAMSEEERLT